MLKKFTTAEVAKFLECSERQVYRYIEQENNPLPVERVQQGSRSGHTYDPIAVKNWAIKKKLSQYPIGPDGKYYDYEAEKARLTHHQANMAEMDETLKMSNLISAELIERTLPKMFSNIKARVHAFPGQCAPTLMSLKQLAQVEDCIRNQIHDLLVELSNMKHPDVFSSTQINQKKD